MGIEENRPHPFLHAPPDHLGPGASKANRRQVGGDHYKNMGIEPWRVFELRYAPDQFFWYLKLTAEAYMLRAGSKGNMRDDLEKAHHTLERALEALDALPPSQRP